MEGMKGFVLMLIGGMIYKLLLIKNYKIKKLIPLKEYFILEINIYNCIQTCINGAIIYV